MALFFFTAVIPFLILVLYKAVNLLRYVRLAKSTGLPYAITPVLETEVLGFLASPILRYIYHDHLNHGRGWPKWCRFIIKDWSWEDKRLAHDEYGDVFLCVSPEGLICYSADATMGWDVMNRRNDFTKPPDKYSELLSPEYTTFQKLQLKIYFKLFRTLGTIWTKRGDGGRSYVPLSCTEYGA